MAWLLLVMFLPFGLTAAGPTHVLIALWTLNLSAARLYLGDGHSALRIRTAFCTVLNIELVEDLFCALVLL